MEKTILLSSAASRVVGFNLIGDAVGYLDFELEQLDTKVVQRVPSKLLSVADDSPVLDGIFPADIHAKGEAATARLFARDGHTVDTDTDIVLILKV